MDMATWKEHMIKRVNEFEKLGEREQGMQMMLLMCVKSGTPMPSPEELAATLQEPNKTA